MVPMSFLAFPDAKDRWVHGFSLCIHSLCHPFASLAANEWIMAHFRSCMASPRKVGISFVPPRGQLSPDVYRCKMRLNLFRLRVCCSSILIETKDPFSFPSTARMPYNQSTLGHFETSNDRYSSTENIHSLHSSALSNVRNHARWTVGHHGARLFRSHHFNLVQ